MMAYPQPRRPDGNVAPRRGRRPAWSLSMLLCVLFIASLVSPFLSWVGRGLTTSWLVFALWCLVSLFEDPRLLAKLRREASGRKLELLMFGFWTLIVLLNMLADRGYAGRMHVMITLTLGMTLVMELANTAQGKQRQERVIVVVLVLLGLEALRSLPTLWSEPLLPRSMMLLGGDSEIYAHGMLASVGEYGFYTGCAIALPYMLAVAMSRRGFARGALLLLCGAIAGAILLATFMGAILLLVLGLGLLGLATLILTRKRMKPLLLLGVVAVSLGIAWSTLIAATEQGQLITDKLELQTTSVLAYGLLEGDQTLRAELWRASVSTFLEHPIFGIGPAFGTDNPYMGYRVGGHSSWLDIPAEYGLVGMSAYALFLAAAIKRAVIAYRAGSRDIVGLARLIGCALFVIAGSYNPVALVIPINTLFFFVVLGGARAVQPVDRRLAPVSIRDPSNASGPRQKAGRLV